MRKYWQVLLAASMACSTVYAVAGEAKAPAATKVAAEQQAHTGTGKVNSIDTKTGKANITHEPIQSLKWPAMTMDFQVKDKEGLSKVKPGDQVEFKVTVPSRGQYIITEIKPKS